MNNNETKKIFTIPNILSVARILLIPAFLWLYIEKENYLLATLLILISGLSDVIDGYIARTFNQISKVGKVLDPAADKLTQAAILIALMFRFDYMLIVFIILAVKESIMLVLGTILYKHTKLLIGSNWHGKLSAIIIYFMLLTHLIWGIKATIPPVVSYSTCALAIIAMNFTFIMYIRDYVILYKQYNIINDKATN